MYSLFDIQRVLLPVIWPNGRIRQWKILVFGNRVALFDQVSELNGSAPVVVDSFEVRRNPRQILQKLCDAVGLEFDSGMLTWPRGGLPCDGPWAPHWYSSVWASTGFGAPEAELPELPRSYHELLKQALDYYEKLAPRALKSE